MLVAKLLSSSTVDGGEAAAVTAAAAFLENSLVTNLIICVALVLFAGFASGMTVGLLSIDPIQLKVLTEQGTDEQKQDARKLESLVQQHHLLLVTLLLANSIAMEALPVFLNHSVPEWAAVMLSVTAILLFGEILPQALCTGKKQFAIVRKSLPLVNVLMYSLFILAWPIAKFLDWFLGKNEQQFYARSHLKALIRLHQKDLRHHGGGHASLHHSNPLGSGSHTASENESALGADEVIVIEGALDMATKTVSGIMVRAEDVFMIEWSTPLTAELRKQLLDAGHSRVPVYYRERWNLKGLLYVKTLICADSNQTPKIGELLRSTAKLPIFCNPETNLYDVLNEFQRGSHMAFVCDEPDWYRENWKKPDLELNDSVVSQFHGIVTLEDVIEELIQEEIYDEFDHYCSGFFTSSTLKGESTLITRTLPRQTPESLVLTDRSSLKRGPPPPPLLEVDSIFADLGNPLLPPPHSETSTVDVQVPSAGSSVQPENLPMVPPAISVRQKRYIVRPPGRIGSNRDLQTSLLSSSQEGKRGSALLTAARLKPGTARKSLIGSSPMVLRTIESGSPETPLQMSEIV